MLTKSFCQRCNMERYSMSGWNYSDEYNWTQGYVWCHVNSVQNFSYIKNNPPDDCPYVLEHVVSKEIS